MDEPILVKTFDGLIGETSESAGPAYSTERLSAARQVRESLEGSKAAEEVRYMYRKSEEVYLLMALIFRS